MLVYGPEIIRYAKEVNMRINEFKVVYKGQPELGSLQSLWEDTFLVNSIIISILDNKDHSISLNLS